MTEIKYIKLQDLQERIEIEKQNCPFSDDNSKIGWGVALLNLEQHIDLLEKHSVKKRPDVLEKNECDCKVHEDSRCVNNFEQ